MNDRPLLVVAYTITKIKIVEGRLMLLEIEHPSERHPIPKTTIERGRKVFIRTTSAYGNYLVGPLEHALQGLELSMKEFCEEVFRMDATSLTSIEEAALTAGVNVQL